MNKQIYFVIIITIIMSLFGCPNEGTDSQSSEDIGSSGKITKLQAVIDSTEVQNGTLTEIDLSKYPDITDYNASINKSVTIKDTQSKDMKGGTLQVVSDGVTLSGIKGANVKTKSSMKITGSSLASLSIAEVSSPSANMMIGRGISSNKAPTVEVSDTIVSSNVTLSIAGAYLAVDNLDAKTAAVNLDAANTKLSIADTQTNIKEIKTDKICQVILENGKSGNNIPTPNVTGEGELKQIDMTAAGELTLLALTPMSGLTTVVKKDESIDFSSVVVLGTYQADDGVTVFKAGGLSYNLTETFSKLEKNFTISIGSKPAYQNGQNVSSFDWTGLSAGVHDASVTSQYSKTAEGYAYSFKITVTEESELPTPILQQVKVYVGADAPKTYYVGDKLNLGSLMVTGVYKMGEVEYESILSDYTLSPANGAVLTANDNVVTVTIPNEEVKGTINLNIHSPVIVKYHIFEGVIIEYRMNGGNDVTADPPKNIMSDGYIFVDWYADADYQTKYDFTQSVTEDLDIYAKWFATAPFIILYHNQNDTADTTAKFYQYDDVSLDLTTPFKPDYTLEGWCEDPDCSGDVITGWEKGEKRGNVELWAKWSYGMKVTADKLSDIMALLSSETNPHLIKITDASPDLSKIKTALRNNSSITIDLDLSQCTEMTKIADNAFDGGTWGDNKICNLHSVVIPDGVTVVGKNAFQYCEGLTSVTIPASVNTILSYAFSGCKNISSVYYKGSLEQWLNIDFGSSGVLYAQSSYNGSGNGGLYINGELVTEVTIPDGITEIKPYVFEGNKKLTKLTIPASVTKIGGSSFYNCTNLTRVDYTGTIEQWCNIDFANNAYLLKYGAELYINDTLVENVTLPNTASIKPNIFNGYKSLKSVTIPSGVTSVGYYAFANSSIESVTIPATVTSFNRSFDGCSNLTEINYTGTISDWMHINFTDYNRERTVNWICGRKSYRCYKRTEERLHKFCGIL
ncbi:MAG: leucine-rich repeat protein [Spirochaetales bacterium]|nr:leucine-rich repeat protein [Spirochaetales bacterium]